MDPDDRDPHLLAMAAIAGSVSVAAAASPERLLRAFGVPEEQTTGAAALGWRLFAVRTGWVALRSLSSREAAGAYLPLQVLDQAVFWHAFATRSVPRRTTLLAAGVSGVLVHLDLRRRGALRGAGPRAGTAQPPD